MIEISVCGLFLGVWKILVRLFVDMLHSWANESANTGFCFSNHCSILSLEGILPTIGTFGATFFSIFLSCCRIPRLVWVCSKDLAAGFPSSSTSILDDSATPSSDIPLAEFLMAIVDIYLSFSGTSSRRSLPAKDIILVLSSKRRLSQQRLVLHHQKDQVHTRNHIGTIIMVKG
jgi:hypothetical protein